MPTAKRATGQSNKSRPRVSFLLALWGRRYIQNFCDFSLRTLLAPGNIPALGKEVNLDFVFLTAQDDVQFFQGLPIVQQLSKYCTLKFIVIDDIIFAGNHSATLTVSLERGMRTYGDQLTDTYFIFLMADYIFAGNALSGLIPHIKAGVSAITAGNYQVIEENVIGDLMRAVDPVTGVIDVPSRQLVKWSLDNLHPVTIANTINVGDTHNSEPNRLFFKTGPGSLVGRFFLRHTLCLKPEHADYVIGASWDYSYLSEMCPSGNYVHFTDSDDYFVLELQGLMYETRFVDPGPYHIHEVADSLAKWTTQEQRDNARIEVRYHVDDEDYRDTTPMEEFVESVFEKMPVDAAPIRGHYFWLSCIRDITEEVSADPNRILSEASNLASNVWNAPAFSIPLNDAGLGMDHLPLRIGGHGETPRVDSSSYSRMFGSGLEAKRWHPRYLDFKLLNDAIRGNRARLLVISSPHGRPWGRWGRDQRIIRSPLIAFRDPDELRLELSDIEECVVALPNQYVNLLPMLVERLQKSLPANARIHVFFATSPQDYDPIGARQLSILASLIDAKLGTRSTSVRVVGSRIRRRLDRSLAMTLQALERTKGRIPRAWYWASAAVLHATFAAYNFLNPSNYGEKDNLADIPGNLCSAVLTVTAVTEVEERVAEREDESMDVASVDGNAYAT